MSLNGRKPDFVACKQEKLRLGYASEQSDQHLCFSLSGKYSSYL